MPKYSIKFVGYETPAGWSYTTKTATRKVLSGFKKEDKIACRKRFGTAKVHSTIDSYLIVSGDKLYSSAYIL